MSENYTLHYMGGISEEYRTADEWYAAYMLMQKRAEPKWRSTLREFNICQIGRYKLEKDVKDG